MKKASKEVNFIQNKTDDYVLTPGGWRKQSKVQKDNKSSFVSSTRGLNKVMNAVYLKFIGIFGKKNVRILKKPNMPYKIIAENNNIGNNNWKAYTQWQNDSGNPIYSLSAQWTVPLDPVVNDNQTIFIYVALQNENWILQPVLQWGLSAAGGGSYWGISCWFANGEDGYCYTSPLVKVMPGTILKGLIELDGKTDSSFIYTASFVGFPNAVIHSQPTDELIWVNATLESVGITDCKCYPPTPLVSLTSINCKTENQEITPIWDVLGTPGLCSESIKIELPSTVNIYYRLIDNS